jgi:dTDP-4-amino-4,6-dideoxygalactose transaminase
LNTQQIFPRRYFYPSLNTISFVIGETMDISESIAIKILCLPLYAGIELSDVNNIIKIINHNN